MIKHTLAVSLTLCALALACAPQVIAQKRQGSPTAIQEVKYNGTSIAAPKQCLFANIVRDETAQKRWLTQELRKSLVQKVATFTSPADEK